MILNRINKVGLAASLLCLLCVTAPAAAAQGWTTLAPAGEGFKLQLPVKPEEVASKVSILGSDYLMKMYTAADASEHVMYMAVMQEFPPVISAMKPSERLEQFVDGFRSGFISNLETTCPKLEMQLQGEVPLKARPGRQYTFTCKDLPGLVRIFDAEKRVYVLLVIGKDEKDPGVARFIQSFEILPAPAPVPQVSTETKPS